MASRLSTAIARRFYSVEGPSAVGGEHHGGAKRWQLISMLIGMPGLALCYINAFYVNSESHEQPAFVPYEHLRLRNKKFPWGDGKHSLFHNSHMNPLPDGYEESH